MKSYKRITSCWRDGYQQKSKAIHGFTEARGLSINGPAGNYRHTHTLGLARPVKQQRDKRFAERRHWSSAAPDDGGMGLSRG